MQRRHFVKLSATATAALLFSRITYAHGNTDLMNTPEEAWGQADAGWFQLMPSGKGTFTYKDVEVNIQANGNASSVYVQSPTLALTAIRLKWKHKVGLATKVMGDHFERSYGDLAWKTPGN